MSTGLSFVPLSTVVGLGASGATKRLTPQVLSGDIGPNSNANGCYSVTNCPVNLAVGPRPRLAVWNDSNVTVRLFPGTAAQTDIAPGDSFLLQTVNALSVALDGAVTHDDNLPAFPAAGWDWTPPALSSYVASQFTIPVYNGLSGANPRGFLFDIDLIPGGSSPTGSVTVAVGVPEYGETWAGYPSKPSVGSPYRYDITVTAGDDGDLKDSFHGPDGLLASHSPEFEPNAPVGEVNGWNGTGAHSHNLVDNVLVAGGNDGGIKHARIYSGRHDQFVVFANITRVKASSGTALWGVEGRNNKITGNTDVGWDGVAFYFEDFDSSTVWPSWGSFVAAAQQDGEYRLNGHALSWPYGEARIVALHFRGSAINMYTKNGSTWTLFKTVTLTIAPLNNDSHRYAGLLLTHYTDCDEFTLLQAAQVELIALPSTVDFALSRVAQNVALGTIAQSAPDLAGFPVGSLNAVIDYGAGPTGWLGVSFSDTSAPCVAILTPDTTDLHTGDYTATVTITAADDLGVGCQITVAISVPNPTLEVTPASDEQIVNMDAVPFDVNFIVSLAVPGGYAELAINRIDYADAFTEWLNAIVDPIAFFVDDTDNAIITLTYNPAFTTQGLYHATVVIDVTTPPGVDQLLIPVVFGLRTPPCFETDYNCSPSTPTPGFSDVVPVTRIDDQDGCIPDEDLVPYDA